MAEQQPQASSSPAADTISSSPAVDAISSSPAADAIKQLQKQIETLKLQLQTRQEADLRHQTELAALKTYRTSSPSVPPLTGCPIMRLPTELHLSIASYLTSDRTSLSKLSRTSKHFRTLTLRPLYLAATEDLNVDLSEVRNISTPCGTPGHSLLRAIKYGHNTLAKQLLALEPSTANTNCSECGTPLHLAVETINLDMVRHLVAAGSQAGVESAQGNKSWRSPAAGVTPLAWLASQMATRWLLSGDPDVEGGQDIEMDEVLQMFQVLLDHGAIAKAPATLGHDILTDVVATPPCIANPEQKTGIVDALVAAGAAVNAPRRAERPALYAAIAAGDVAVVKHLLSLGADIHARNETGRSMLHAAVRAKSCHRENCRMDTCYVGHKEMVEMLLEAGANEWAVDDAGLFPISAAMVNHVALAELLNARMMEKTGKELFEGGKVPREKGEGEGDEAADAAADVAAGADAAGTVAAGADAAGADANAATGTSDADATPVAASDADANAVATSDTVETSDVAVPDGAPDVVADAGPEVGTNAEAGVETGATAETAAEGTQQAAEAPTETTVTTHPESESASPADPEAAGETPATATATATATSPAESSPPTPEETLAAPPSAAVAPPQPVETPEPSATTPATAASAAPAAIPTDLPVVPVVAEPTPDLEELPETELELVAAPPLPEISLVVAVAEEGEKEDETEVVGVAVGVGAVGSVGATVSV